MGEWAIVILGFSLGAALGWLVAKVRAKTSEEELFGRARAAEAQAGEFRAQVDLMRKESAEFQAQIRRIENDRTAATTRAAEMEKAIQEQKTLLEDAKMNVGYVQILATDAIKSSNQDFLTLAKQVSVDSERG